MKTHRAFTLIELLIVIAIISIISTALLATLIAPLREQARVDIQATMENGSALFFSRIVTDVHGADSLVVNDEGTRIDVFPLFDRDSQVVYSLGRDRMLRRWQGPRTEAPATGADPDALGAALVPSVEELRFTLAEDNASTMSIRLLARQEVMEQTLVVDRSLTLLTNGAWKGARP